MSEQFDWSSDGDYITAICRTCGQCAVTPFGPQARAWTLNHACPPEEDT